MTPSLPFTLLESTRWKDYALLDSGDGLKLERFGKYVFVRPESQAMWKRVRPIEWMHADATFMPTGEESGGHWDIKKKMDEQWVMSYPFPRFDHSAFYAPAGDRAHEFTAIVDSQVTALGTR